MLDAAPHEHAAACELVKPDRDLFSIVRRKVLTPNYFATLAALELYLLAFQHRYQAIAQRFDWTFTRADLQRLLAILTAVRPTA